MPMEFNASCKKCTVKWSTKGLQGLGLEHARALFYSAGSGCSLFCMFGPSRVGSRPYFFTACLGWAWSSLSPGLTFLLHFRAVPGLVFTLSRPLLFFCRLGLDQTRLLFLGLDFILPISMQGLKFPVPT